MLFFFSLYMNAMTESKDSGKSEREFKQANDHIRQKKIERVALFHRDVEVITRDDEFPSPSDKDGKAFLCLINGRRKSGKTYFADNLMFSIWLKLFDRIYILSKTAHK